MLQRNDAIDHLVSLLDAGAERALSGAELSLLRAALAELAGAQVTIARQEALLASYEHDTRAIELAAASALDRIRAQVSADAQAPAYHFAAAQKARAELIRRVNEAAHGKEILEAILRFVAAAARLAV
jgi:hypothetical protein